MKLFKKKDPTLDVIDVEIPQTTALVEEPQTTDTTPIGTSSMEDLENVGNTSNEIKQQSLPKSIFSGGKNIRALAENDLVISKVLKNMLDWLLVVTSAETLRFSSPLYATEIFPVSSEAIIVRESVTSLMPTPARCLVPSSLLSLILSESGR